jgi:flagellar biosynthesis protein FlhF
MYLQLKFGGKKILQNGAAALRTQIAERESSTAPVLAPEAVSKTPEKRPEPAATPGQGPRIKTYIAESVPQAMTLARREMGDDAILIQTQRRETIDPAKRFEVTFGIVPGAAPQPAKAAAKPAITEPLADPGMETEVARELGSLRRELISLQIMLRQSSFGKSNGPQNNDAAYEAYAVLLGNDIDEELASELIRLIEPNSKSPADAVRAQLATQIHTDSTVAQDGKAVVLMGPPASGKTTALIKLAVEYGLKLGNPIEIFSLSKGKANVDRTLEAMTAILGVPCEALPNAAALAAALDRPRAAGTLVLVDTNGYGTSAADEDMELASVLVSGEKADVHLVLSAAWHRVSIRQTVDNFEIFQPARLLFTMLDQAAVYGPLIQEAWRTQKPLSFVSGGKAGATALRPADLGWIVERMYGVARETVSARD